ncbi:hypothetical protein SCOR_30190 [Sulfidibacter corallicola]
MFKKTKHSFHIKIFNLQIILQVKLSTIINTSNIRYTCPIFR